MKNIFWFRRDLRLTDNHGLFRALSAGLPVQTLFVYDRQILDLLEPDDARVQFIREQLAILNHGLKPYDASLRVMEGDPVQVFGQLVSSEEVHAVYANEDYEPYALGRDEAVGRMLRNKGITLHLLPDHLIMPPGRVLKDDGKPYTVFTPFMKRWKSRFNSSMINPYPDQKLMQNLAKEQTSAPFAEPSGFTGSVIRVPKARLDENTLTQYAETRNRPDWDATTYLGTQP
jgi:deoxyribodipyrimidine photo-lyase